jgi:hypothetical protein
MISPDESVKRILLRRAQKKVHPNRLQSGKSSYAGIGIFGNSHGILPGVCRATDVGVKGVSDFVLGSVGRVAGRSEWLLAMFADGGERVIEVEDAKIPVWHGKPAGSSKPGTSAPLHTQEPVTVASFRTWRGWREDVARD